METTESGSGNVAERIARLERQDERMTRALELLAQQASAPPAPPRRNWDAYAAVIASLVGLLALGVSAYTAHVQRQQLRAQVWPHLRLWSSDVHLGWYVTNVGTGPARITGARVTVDGTPVAAWEDFRKAAGFTEEEGFVRSTIGDVVLPPDKDDAVVQPAEGEASQKKFQELLSRTQHLVTMAVCFCSILEECWVVDSAAQSREVRPADVCPIPAAERFTQ